MSDVMENLTPAEKSSIMQKALHDDSMRRSASEVMDLRKSWDASKKVAAERKNAFDEAMAELLMMAVSGPPKPDPQMKLPLMDSDEGIAALAIPGEIQDLMEDAGIDTMQELGLLIRGEHDDYDDVAGIRGMSAQQAKQVEDAYRAHCTQIEDEEADDDAEYEDVDQAGDTPIVEAPKAPPVESDDDDIPSKDKCRVRVKEKIDDCPFVKGSVVDARKLEDGSVLASDTDNEFMLNVGEFEFA